MYTHFTIKKDPISHPLINIPFDTKMMLYNLKITEIYRLTKFIAQIEDEDNNVSISLMLQSRPQPSIETDSDSTSSTSR